MTHAFTPEQAIADYKLLEAMKDRHNEAAHALKLWTDFNGPINYGTDLSDWLDWLRRIIEKQGYTEVKGDFYKNDDLKKLSPLSPPSA